MVDLYPHTTGTPVLAQLWEFLELEGFSHFLDTHLHQVWGHQAPAAHHMQQGPRLGPYNPQHGIPQAEQVEGTFPVMGGFNFS